MLVNIPEFLKVFAVSIPQQQTGVNRSLPSLRCRCPLHQDANPDGSLVVTQNPDTYDVKFACTDSRCGFRGDPVAFVSVARKISVQAAMELFRPGGEFAHTLPEPLRSSDIEAYLHDSGAQASIKAFLSVGEHALRIAPEKAGIRPGLSATHSKVVPSGPALFVPPSDGTVPNCLVEFSKPKYKGRQIMLYPYTYDGNVSAIDVLDASNPFFSERVQVTRSDIGVFGEYLYSNRGPSFQGKTVYVCKTPLAATRFRCAYLQSSMGIEDIPAVSIAGLPLPDSFADLHTVVLVSFPDAAFTADDALQMLASDPFISGSQTCPSIKIHLCKKRIVDLTSEDARVLADRAKTGRDVAEWCVSTLIDLVSKGRSQEVGKTISAHPMSKMLSEELSRFALTCKEDREACAEVAKLFSAPAAPVTSSIVLANGKAVKKTASSILALYPNGCTETLSNVGLSVESKILSCDGVETSLCMVTPPDKDIPPVSVSIPETDYSPQRMQRVVQKAFTTRGYNPYVAFYQMKGYDWRDIMGRLSERCVVQKEVSELGIDDVSDVQFPGFTLRSSGDLVKQSRVFTLPDHVLRVYGGLSIDSQPEDPATAWRKCFSSCDNLYVAAFTLGVMHVLYQATFGLYKPEAARKHANRHFFFVETEPGIWGTVFKQVADLFSGSDFTPTINYSSPSESLSEYSKLGNLPLIAYVPTIGGKFSKALDESRVDLVGILDTSTAVMTNGKISAVYVTPSSDIPANRSVIASSDLDTLRRSFPWLLSLFVKEANIDAAYRSSTAPCLTAFKECCRVLGVETTSVVDEIAKTWFPGTGMNGVSIFFDMMHRGISEDGKPKVCVMEGRPPENRSFTQRGQHVFVMGDCAIVSHVVVDMFNQKFKGVCEFSTEQLTRELEDRDMLTPLPEEVSSYVDGTRCWCLRREVWETNIVRPPINLSQIVTNGSVVLRPVSGE